MRVIALDIGEVRVGIAISNKEGTIASPVKVLPANEVLSYAKSFRFLLEDFEPEMLVCGRPLTMAGELGLQAQKITEQAQKIAAQTGLPLEFQDERLSSSEAKNILREQGFSEKQMRGKVDSIAASLFLQSWLDAHQQEE